MIKNLKAATANALKLCLQGITILNTHPEIHNLARKAMPANVCLYRHVIMAFKLIKGELCEDEFVQLNFQLVDNARQTKQNFIKIQRFDVGKNILLNRLYVLNGKIDKSWMNLSLDSFKIKCKELFLR